MQESLSKLKAQPLLLVSEKGVIKKSNDGFGQAFFPVQTDEAGSAYVHPEDRNEFQSWFRNLNHQRSESSTIKNIRRIDTNGRVVPAKVRPESVPEEDYVFWFWEDRELHSAEDYREAALTPAMEEVFSSILDGVFVVNVEGKLIDVNQALCTMLGCHKFEVIGLPVGKLFASDAPEIKRATMRFARIMKYGRVQEVNLTLKDRAGNEVEVSFNGAVIRREGTQLTGILGTASAPGKYLIPSREAGDDMLIPKPFSPKAFMRQAEGLREGKETNK